MIKLFNWGVVGFLLGVRFRVELLVSRQSVQQEKCKNSNICESFSNPYILIKGVSCKTLDPNSAQHLAAIGFKLSNLNIYLDMRHHHHLPHNP